jgi:type I restriction enzyme S subunit
MRRRDLPEDWRTVSLEDVADFINGYSFKSTEWNVSGLPIIRIQNLNDNSKTFNHFLGEIDEKYKVRSGDILISWSASLGAYLWDKGEAWLNQHIFKSVINENVIDRGFFFWIMKSEIDRIAESARGSTMKHVTRKTFVNSAIPLPPLPEQRAIARALRAVQGTREARLRELALERERKAALMEHLFTHGTRGEATKMTEIGEMPESWSISTLKDTTMNIIVPTRDKPKLFGGPYPWITIPDLKNDLLDIFSSALSLTKENADEVKNRLMPKETVLLSCAGSLGKSVILGVPSYANQQFYGFICRSDKIIPQYLCYRLKSFPEEYFKRIAGITTLSFFSKGVALSIKISLPILDEQQEIARVLQNCDSKIAALDHEAHLHDELFRAILEELMSGRLPAGTLVEDAALS